MAALRLAVIAGDLLIRATGLRAPIDSQRLLALIENTHFSSAKLTKQGFAHPQSTEDGIADMVRWYREQQGRFNKKG